MATKHNSVSLMKADDTEPIFVLRAQDSLAAAVVRFWADEAEKAGSNPAKIIRAITKAARVGSAFEADDHMRECPAVASGQFVAGVVDVRFVGGAGHVDDLQCRTSFHQLI